MNRRKYDLKKRKMKKLVSTTFSKQGGQQKVSVSSLTVQHIHIEVTLAKGARDKAQNPQRRARNKSAAPALHIVK